MSHRCTYHRMLTNLVIIYSIHCSKSSIRPSILMDGVPIAAKVVLEERVKRIEPGTVPTASVKCALEGLPLHVSRNSRNEQSFRHWTIRDYAEAYTSGRLTPTEVLSS